MPSEQSEDSTEEEEIEARLDAIEKNIQWLRDHDVEEKKTDALHRVNFIKADAQALGYAVADSDPRQELGEELLRRLGIND